MLSRSDQAALVQSLRELFEAFESCFSNFDVFRLNERNVEIDEGNHLLSRVVKADSIELSDKIEDLFDVKSRLNVVGEQVNQLLSLLLDIFRLFDEDLIDKVALFVSRSNQQDLKLVFERGDVNRIFVFAEEL